MLIRWLNLGAGVAYLKACINGGGIGYRHFDAIPLRWRSTSSHLIPAYTHRIPNGMPRYHSCGGVLWRCLFRRAQSIAPLRGCWSVGWPLITCRRHVPTRVVETLETPVVFYWGRAASVAGANWMLISPLIKSMMNRPDDLSSLMRSNSHKGSSMWDWIALLSGRAPN